MTLQNTKRLSHQDRLAILAQLCYERGVNPQKGNYAGFVRAVCCGKLFLSNQTAIQLTKTLTTAYYADRWNDLLGKLNEGQSVGEEGCALQPLTWNPQPQQENVKAETKKAELSLKQLSQILYGKAQRDTFNCIGRITEADAKEINLTIEEAQQIWSHHHTKFETEIRGNCLLIFWNGKGEMRSQRNLLCTVQPTEPQITAQTGDIVDDTYDKTVSEVNDNPV